MVERAPPFGDGYRRFWAAASVSYLGDGVFLTTLPLLAAAASANPAGVTIVTTAASLPWLALSLASGVIADRTRRITLMWRVDLARAVITAVLAAALLAGHRTIPVLAIAAFALGCTETLFDTASQAVLPELVSDDPVLLTRANGRLEATHVTANQFIGPPLGGLLTSLGPAVPVLVNMASFAASAATLRTIQSAPPLPVTRDSMRSDVAEGLAWLWHHRRLRSLAIAVGSLNLALTASFMLLVLITRQYLQLGPVGYGMILAIGAVGSTAAGLTLSWVTKHVSADRVIFAVPAVLGGALLAIAIHPTTPVVACSLAIVGYGGSSWNVLTVTYRQSVVPGRLLGRVNSVYRLIAFGTMPVGAILGGVLATSTTLRAPYLASGLLLLATTTIVTPQSDGDS
jgi:MFS family permease